MEFSAGHLITGLSILFRPESTGVNVQTSGEKRVNQFHDGEQVRILKSGLEVEMIVFRQSGDWVYVFDRDNRVYQFHVSDVLGPVRSWAGCRERQA